MSPEGPEGKKEGHGSRPEDEDTSDTDGQVHVTDRSRPKSGGGTFPETGLRGLEVHESTTSTVSDSRVTYPVASCDTWSLLSSRIWARPSARSSVGLVHPGGAGADGTVSVPPDEKANFTTTPHSGPTLV